MQNIEPVFSLQADPLPWKRNLNEYPRIQGFKFQSLRDCFRCIDILAEEPLLKGVPMHPLGSDELLVPSEAAGTLSAALKETGIPFTERRVRETAALTGPALHVSRTERGWAVK
jgi:hypothetical protein